MASTTATIDDIANSIGHLLGVPTAFVLTAGLGVLAFWVSKRTRSFHLLRMRAWRLFYGRRAIANVEIQQFEQALDALLLFRMATGINARTWPAAVRVLEWTRQYNENPLDIGACGATFDTEKCEFVQSKVAGKSVTGCLVFACFALCLLTAAIGMTAVLPKLLYKTNVTGIWFSMTRDRAQPIGRTDSITVGTCSADNGRAALSLGFNQAEVTAICSSFSRADGKPSFDDELSHQHRLSLALTVLLGAYGWFVGGMARTAVVTREVSRRLAAGPPRGGKPGP